MFILSSVSSGIEFWSLNYTLKDKKKSKLKEFKNTKFLGEASNDWSNDLLGSNVYKTVDFF